MILLNGRFIQLQRSNNMKHSYMSDYDVDVIPMVEYFNKQNKGVINNE